MDIPAVECNKWLWQPHRNGAIYLRVTYRDANGRRRTFTRSLNTNHWPTARKIRDAEFAPIILDIEKAAAQLALIQTLYPELEKRLAAGVHGGYAEKTKPGATLATATTEWQEALAKPGGNYATAVRTARRYAAIGGLFVAHVGGDRPLSSVAAEDIVSYRDSRLTETGASKKTVDLEMVALRSLFRFALEKHRLPTNPAVGIAVLRTRAERNRETRQAKRRPPTRVEADRICTAFPIGSQRYPAADYQDYALFARYTGMRRGEIAQLRTGDFQLYPATEYVDAILANRNAPAQPFTGDIPDGQVLCILVADAEERTTKTGLERLVPVADKLLPVVRRRLATADQGVLFPFAVNDSGADFGRRWLKNVKKIEGTLTMHGFRHYAVSEMKNNGVNTGISSLILGHVEGDVHDDYFHKQVGSLKEAVDRIY